MIRTMKDKSRFRFERFIGLSLKILVYVILLSFFMENFHYLDNNSPKFFSVTIGTIIIVIVLPIISTLIIDKLFNKKN